MAKLITLDNLTRFKTNCDNNYLQNLYKNLLDFNKCYISGLSQGVGEIDYENKTITFTNATGSDQYAIIASLTLKPNTTYVFSVTSTQNMNGYVYIDDWVQISNGSGKTAGRFTTNSSGVITIRLDNEGGAGSTCVFSELMLNEGDVSLPYTEYAGTIIYEKQISDVEHIETVYDMRNPRYQEVNGVCYTSGIKINGALASIPINIDDSLKKIIVWIQSNIHGDNWFGDGTASLIIDTTQRDVNADPEYRGNLTTMPFNSTSPYGSNVDIIYSFLGRISQDLGIQNLVVEGLKYEINPNIKQLISSENGNTSDYIRITKVQVVR